MARTKELTVEDKLKYLYELQQVDSKIDALRTLAGELPQEVKDMADEVEGLKTRLANIENDIKECEMQISDHRVRTENANASISRYREQQNSVRNNREFDNLNKEIEYQELEIEASQRKIKHFSAELEARLEEKAKTIKCCLTSYLRAIFLSSPETSVSTGKIEQLRNGRSSIILIPCCSATATMRTSMFLIL